MCSRFTRRALTRWWSTGRGRFAGLVIGRRGHGVNETFTVRRISYGEGVERVFPVHSPRIEKVVVDRQGKVRRAKLTYLRERIGKRALAVKARDMRTKKN